MGRRSRSSCRRVSRGKLQDYLNNIYEKQANVHFTVIPTTFHTVDYDILPGGIQGVLDARNDVRATEMNPIVVAAKNSAADINIYYVTDFFHPDAPAAIGLNVPDTTECFVKMKGNTAPLSTAAHEIGHTFGLQHPDIEFFDLAHTMPNPFYMPQDDFRTRLMYSQDSGEPQKRLVKKEWLIINPLP